MEPTPNPTPSKTRKTPLLPRGDRQLAAVGISVGDYWLTRPWLTLRYITAAEFAPKTVAYDKAISARQQAGSARPADADELLDLDELIERSLYRIKNRLIDKTDKKKAPTLYPKLGIVKYKGDYIIARERTERAAALNTLVAGLTTEGIADGEWGTSFWQPIAKRYNELVVLLTAADGKVSQAVAAKDLQRDFIEQVLSSIAQVISANFPDEAEYKAELRAAGFQREKYK